MFDLEYKIFDNRELNLGTVAIRLYRCIEGDYTLVYQMDDTFVIRKKPLDLIDELAIKFGSTYRGRVESAKYLTKATQKVPVLINPTLLMIATPTHSPKHVDNTWVFMNHVKDFKANKQNKTVDIIFNNGSEMTLPVSYHIFKNQVAVTDTLLAMYKTNEEKSNDEKAEFMLRSVLREYIKQPSNEMTGLFTELMMQILSHSTIVENPKVKL